MSKKVSAPRRSRAVAASVENLQALYRAARLYRAEHDLLKQMPRGKGFDRRWTEVADRARLARSLFLALLEDAQPRIAR